MSKIEKSASYGKFSSAEELFGAYRALEREFTRRCMRLKDAENEIAALRARLAALEENDAAEKAVEEYLMSVLSSAPAPSLNSSVGSSALTPVRKPKSLGEARALAEKMLK